MGGQLNNVGAGVSGILDQKLEINTPFSLLRGDSAWR